jgi:hypothetical protein
MWPDSLRRVNDTDQGAEMAKYTLLIYTPAEGPPADVDPAVQTQRFVTFTERLQRDGVLLGGERLQETVAATTVRRRDGELGLTDGPFAETKEYLAGYYLLECADLDKALAYAADIPNVDYASIEVRPVMPIA